MLEVLNINPENEMFLEPSAGSGSFSDLPKNIEAYDIKPENDNIIEADFLKLELSREDYITIGNPPFGKKSSLAIEFFNKTARHSKVVAMILPSTFMKWSVQSKLDPSFKLVEYKKLEEESFTFQGAGFSVRTYFMIWTRKDLFEDKVDLRIQEKPKISHKDFEIWQHNATPGSRKYLEEDWEIATWRQGYADYNNLFTRKDYDELKDVIYNTNKQLFFIKPKTEESKDIIYSMDFNELAKRNLSTPGFGKADFVSYYEEILSKK
jgi:hypothetical protein